MGSRAENGSWSRSCAPTSASVCPETSSRALTLSSRLRPRRSAAGALRFTAFAILLIVCSSGHAATLIDTGAYLSRSSKVYWISDDAIIFGGYDGAKGVPQQLRPPWPKPIYTARFLEYHNATRRLVDRGLISSGGPCFDGGFVRYAKPVPEVEDAALQGKWQPFYGEYGHETAFKPDPTPRNYFARSWNCMFEHELSPLPSWATGKQIKRLRPEHGYVEFAGVPRNNWHPIRLIPAGKLPADGIPVNGLAGLETDWPFAYESPKNAYLIEGRRSAESAGVSQYELWRLSLDGSLERLLVMGNVSPSERTHVFRLATGQEIRFPSTISEIVPLGKHRYAFSGGFFNRQGRLGDTGLYLLDAGRIHKMAKGRISAFALSPEGCRAAMGIDSQDPTGPDQFRVHILDACEVR